LLLGQLATFQLLGRIARKSEGKNDAILLDAIGLSHSSRFGRSLDWRCNSVLIGASAEQQKKYKNYLQKVAKLGNL